MIMILSYVDVRSDNFTTEPAAPIAAAAAVSKGESSKKSTELKPTEGATETRASSSSSSEDENKKSKKAKSKSRSVSRGKRASIFGSLLGKKDEIVEKQEAKKEEKAEEKAEKKEEEKAEEATAAVGAAPVPSTEEAKPAAADTPEPVLGKLP
jgi:hypothetical protein